MLYTSSNKNLKKFTSSEKNSIEPHWQIS